VTFGIARAATDFFSKTKREREREREREEGERERGRKFSGDKRDLAVKSGRAGDRWNYSSRVRKRRRAEFQK